MNTATDSPVRLRVEGLTKSFSGVRVIHGVTFDAHSGCVLGIVGENGSGKSTTMNLLAGVLSRDSGRILLDGELFEPLSRRESESAGVAFIQQELNIFPNLTVAENLFLTRHPVHSSLIPLVSRREMHVRARELLQTVDLDVSPDTSAGRLSPGERQLVEIARGLASRARILIFDEPTTSLTDREILRLFEIIRTLQRQRVAVLYISHDLEQVLQLAENVVVMRDGVVTLRAPCSGLVARDLVVAMVGRSIDSLYPARKKEIKDAKPLLEADGVSEPGVLDNVTLRVRKGEIVGIAGLMGSGRTELARTLFGLDGHQSGAIRVDRLELLSGDVRARLTAGVALLTEDRRLEGLMSEASVIDNIALAALPLYASRFGWRVRRESLLKAIHNLIGRMNLKSGDIDKTPVQALSGGNQQKVVLGRWLLRQPRVFILDEPTRGVDVGAKEEIYRLLAELSEAGAAILIISSDLEELIGLSDRILVMRRGALQAEFDSRHFDREAILRAAFGQGDVT